MFIINNDDELLMKEEAVCEELAARLLAVGVSLKGVLLEEGKTAVQILSLDDNEERG
jgi:hypothetical protein